MNSHQSYRNSPTNWTLGDAMKYNLRCNRNISEKMTKKDFVYDIRPPIQSSRKASCNSFCTSSLSTRLLHLNYNCLF